MKENLLLSIISALGTSILALACYTYITHKEDIDASIDDGKDVSISLEQRVDDLTKEMLIHKNILDNKVGDTKVNLLERIYNQGNDINKKMNDVKTNSEIANKNYEVLSAKFDNFVSQAKEDRQTFLTKLEEHERRIGDLEKNVNTIAQEKNITLFGWKYGYGT